LKCGFCWKDDGELTDGGWDSISAKSSWQLGFTFLALHMNGTEGDDGTEGTQL